VSLPVFMVSFVYISLNRSVCHPRAQKDHFATAASIVGIMCHTAKRASKKENKGSVNGFAHPRSSHPTNINNNNNNNILLFSSRNHYLSADISSNTLCPPPTTYYPQRIEFLLQYTLICGWLVRDLKPENSMEREHHEVGEDQSNPRDSNSARLANDRLFRPELRT
jgi:hypothetical protein